MPNWSDENGNCLFTVDEIPCYESRKKCPAHATRAYHPPSATVEWATPQKLFDELNARFGFTLDVAASAENAKCHRYFTKEQDGLAQSWANEVVWCNPPYGREIALWVKKARESSIYEGTTVVLLVPARTDTRWFHDEVLACDTATVEFMRGRVKFGGATAGAPFPTMLVIFQPRSV